MMRHYICLLFCVLLGLFSCKKTPQEEVIPVTSVMLNQVNAEIDVGGTLQLQVSIMPLNASDKKVVWSSSNAYIATVSDNGLVKAFTQGETLISATCGGKTATCTVTVVMSLTGLSFEQEAFSLYMGETQSLSLIRTPSGAQIRNEIKWQSSNAAVASISDEGVVTALSQGNTIVTASADGCQASCTVSVLTAVSGVGFINKSISIAKGHSRKLEFVLLPEGATPKGETSWSSSNPDIVSVDDQGVVLGLQAGSATVSLTIDGFTDDCMVTVSVPVKSIRLSYSSLDIVKGKSEKLDAEIQPEDATEKNIVWSSGDEKVATVDQEGTITAVSGGKAIIKASIEDISAECEIRVVVPVEEVVFTKTEVSIKNGEQYHLQYVLTPGDATIDKIQWRKSNNTDTIFTINEDGVIQALSSGSGVVWITVFTYINGTQLSSANSVCYVSILGDSSGEGFGEGGNGEWN